jgi:hypothetical protein
LLLSTMTSDRDEDIKSAADLKAQTAQTRKIRKAANEAAYFFRFQAPATAKRAMALTKSVATENPAKTGFS